MIRKKRVFILFDLNLLTLPILLISLIFYHRVYFFLCSKRVKRFFGFLITRLNTNQILGRDFYQGGTHYEGQYNAFLASREINKRFYSVGKALNELGNHDNYESIFENILGLACYRNTYMAPFICKFFKFLKREQLNADIFLTSPLKDFFLPTSYFSNIREVRWHFAIIKPLNILIRILIVLAVFLFPLANIIFLFSKGIKVGKKEKKINSKPLFIHRHNQYKMGSKNLSRDMYLFRTGILDYREWLHMPMSSNAYFDQEKISHLKLSGGELLNKNKFYLSFKFLLEQIIIKHTKFSNQAAKTLISEDLVSIRLMLILFEHLHLQSFCQILLNNELVSFIHFETEFSPIARILSIEAKKKNIKTAAMIHGAGIMRLKYVHRMNMQFDYLLTPGKGFGPLRETCPQISNFLPVGNQEVDLTNPEDNILPQTIVENRAKFKIVGVMLDFQSGFIEEDSHFPSGVNFNSVVVDESRIKKHAIKLLQPIIDWAKNRPDIIILWKPKRFNSNMNENNKFLKKLISQIPKSKIIFKTYSQLYETISLCDVCITSGFSSAVSNAISCGIPSISFDTLYGKLEAKYHPWMAAETGNELVDKLELILEEGLPKEVFEKYNSDFYGDGIVDFKTKERLSSFFNNAIPNLK